MAIDWWTLGIETVNVLVLVWLLARFFWRPVAAIVGQRQALARAILTEAETKRGEAAAALAEIEHTRANFAQERAAVLASAHEAAERLRSVRLDEAAKEAAAIEAAARAAIAREKVAADKAWTERASQLAVEIAEHLAKRLDGPAIHAAFLDWLVAEVRRLPEPTRLVLTAPDVTLEAVSATKLDSADEERCRRQIAEALGAEPKISFIVDPSLIAGLELRGRDVLISNSWNADLNQILGELTHVD